MLINILTMNKMPSPPMTTDHPEMGTVPRLRNPVARLGFLVRDDLIRECQF